MTDTTTTDPFPTGARVRWTGWKGDGQPHAVTGTILPGRTPAHRASWRLVQPDNTPDGTTVEVPVDAFHRPDPQPACGHTICTGRDLCAFNGQPIGQPSDDALRAQHDAYVTDALDPDDAGEWIDLRPVTHDGETREATLTAFTDGDNPVIAVYLIDRESRPGLPDGIAWLADFARREDAERFAATFHLPVQVTSTDPAECRPAAYPRIAR